MLQVSTTFYFVFWGYNYGLSNIWYVVTWALGILIFSRFSPQLLMIRSQYETLPSFLAGGSFTTLRYIASLVTIISFLAIYYVELYFCADFITVLADPYDNQDTDLIWWVFFLILTGLTVLYSLFGGMRRVVITDRWQLSFAYICIAIIFSYLLTKSFIFSPLSGICVAALMLALFIALFWFNRGDRNRLIVQLAIMAAIFILVVATVTSFRAPDTFAADQIEIEGPFHQLKEAWGWVTLLGFSIVNLLWQFCDNSNYQRIASVNLPANPEQASRLLRRLISRLVVVSPLTWGLGIVLGIAIRTAGVEVPASGKEYLALLSSLKHAALAGDAFALVAVLALSTALTSIMMETVDSALIAFAQTFLRDMSGERELRIRRIVAISLITYVFVICFAVLHRGLANTSILTVMAGSYSALVVLAVPAIMRLLGIELRNWFVIAGIVLGFVATWFATFGPPFAELPQNVKIVLPFFAGPIGAFLPIMVGLFVRRTLP